MIKEVIILAGGFGTRLAETVPGLPKSLAPINGRPFLEYVLDYLELFGVKKVILATGYMHEAIESHFGDKYKYIRLVYSREDEPLGTGGAVLKALQMAEGKWVLVMNGDTMFRVNLGKLYDFQLIKNSDLTIVVKEIKDATRYGTVELDETGRITAFREKGEAAGPAFINGGVYALRKDFMLSAGLPPKFSLERDFFEKIYPTHPIYAFRCYQYFLDIGIPTDYERAQTDFRTFEF
ncbi:MAG: nucleotidyltransferase family protein [Bacteroidales bacterium]